MIFETHSQAWWQKHGVFVDDEGIIHRRPGAHGVDFRITDDANYHVGALLKGAVKLSEDGSSLGTLFITNTRIFLEPEPGNKHVSIPLNSILTFNCFSNGIEIWQEGREQAYLFSISNSGAVEIFGLCLIFSLDAESRQE